MDNGGEFVNQVIEQLLDRLQIKKSTTPTYNPQSNLVERWHRTLNAMLRIFMEREDTQWNRYLSGMVLAYNTKVNATTQITPFMAMFGRKCRLPVDLIIPPPQEPEENLNQHVEATINRFKWIYQFMRKNNEDSIRRNTQLYHGETKKYLKNKASHN